MGRLRFSTEQLTFLAENVKGTSCKNLTELFNSRFNTRLEARQIKEALDYRGLKNGRDTRFKQGHIPTKRVYTGGKETQFKKGNLPPGHRPVGSERVTVNGYIKIKVEEPGVWKGKHIVEWEKVNGPIPKEHFVIFGDGDKRNFNIENLILVSRAELNVMSKNGLRYNDTELTRTGKYIASVRIALKNQKKKGKRKCHAAN